MMDLCNSKGHWRAIGKIFTPSGRDEKLFTHAANPLAVPMDEHIYRVFFNARDSKNRSSIGAVDIDFDDLKIVKEHERAFFSFDPQSDYFNHGVSIGNCFQYKGKHYIGFMGWHFPDNHHWQGNIGLLHLTDDFEIELHSHTPWLMAEDLGLHSLSYPWIEARPSGLLDVWLGGTVSWDAGNGEMLHKIIHLESDFEGNYNITGNDIPHEIGKAQAFSRPSVYEDEAGRKHMVFSYRAGQKDTYKIGYSRYKNGKWQFPEPISLLQHQNSKWDNQMIEYPFTFFYQNNLFMLYNGNDFGKTGFGLAQWVND